MILQTAHGPLEAADLVRTQMQHCSTAGRVLTTSYYYAGQLVKRDAQIDTTEGALLHGGGTVGGLA